MREVAWRWWRAPVKLPPALEALGEILSCGCSELTAFGCRYAFHILRNEAMMSLCALASAQPKLKHTCARLLNLPYSAAHTQQCLEAGRNAEPAPLNSCCHSTNLQSHVKSAAGTRPAVGVNDKFSRAACSTHT